MFEEHVYPPAQSVRRVRKHVIFVRSEPLRIRSFIVIDEKQVLAPGLLDRAITSAGQTELFFMDYSYRYTVWSPRSVCQ